MATYTWTGTNGTFSTAGNWTPSGPPTTGDTVIFDHNATRSIDGANQSAVLLASLVVTDAFAYAIGSAGTELQIGATSLEIGKPTGNGQSYSGPTGIYLNTGTNANTTTIYGTGSTTPATGKDLVHIRGVSTSNELTMQGGSVGIATNAAADTATTPTINVTGGRLNIGTGATLTTVTIAGGTLVGRSAITTLNINGGTVETYGTFAITTVNNKTGGRFNCLHRNGTSNAIGTYNMQGGTLDVSKDARTIIVGTWNSGPGSVKKATAAQITGEPLTTYREYSTSATV
jgi:hypothetical protein